MLSPAPKPFDPWTSSAAEALRAQGQHVGDGPGPLAQHQAARQVLESRAACLAPGLSAGRVVMGCVRACGVSRLVQPDWLAGEFSRRYMLVDRLDVGSWDDALGRPGPRGEKRLAAERARKKLKALVHASVFRLTISENDLPINSDLFKRISELPGVGVGASTVKKLYYSCIREGMVDIAALRCGDRPSSTKKAVKRGTRTATEATSVSNLGA